MKNPQTVNFIEEDTKDSLAAWLIVTAATAKDNDEEVINNIIAITSDAEHLQIEFRVNGVDLPFLETLATLKEQFFNQVKEEAKSLISEKFSGISSMLINLEDIIQEKIDEA